MHMSFCRPRFPHEGAFAAASSLSEPCAWANTSWPATRAAQARGTDEACVHTRELALASRSLVLFETSLGARERRAQARQTRLRARARARLPTQVCSGAIAYACASATRASQHLCDYSMLEPVLLTHLRMLPPVFSKGGNLGRSPKPYKMKSWVEAAAARGGFCMISCPRTWQLAHGRSTHAR